MKWIFSFVAGLAMVLIAMSVPEGKASGEEPPRPVVKFASVFPVSGPPRQYELVQQILDFPPGGATREHSHGGRAFVTVLEGQSTVREGASEKVYGPGETYTEVEGAVLTAFNKGNVRTRVLASFLLSPGALQTINRPDSPVPAIPAVPAYLSRSTFGTQPAEFEVRQVVNEFAPGAVQPLHTHSGPGIAMVIEGEVTFEVAGQNLRRLPGGFFVENDPHLAHLARNSGSGPATVVVTFLIPKGQPQTTFVTPPDTAASAPVVRPSGAVAAVPIVIRAPSTGDGGLLSGSRTSSDRLAVGFTVLLAVSALFAMRRFTVRPQQSRREK
jgi:quercetin dioxygenase-like cupin family protein